MNRFSAGYHVCVLHLPFLLNPLPAQTAFPGSFRYRKRIGYGYYIRAGSLIRRERAKKSGDNDGKMRRHKACNVLTAPRMKVREP
jgi:hypothetical protein